MFISVLYGDNEESLFNINCKVQLLVESIKNTCHYENEGEIELADESGQVKNLLENQQRYASELLNEREMCVLLAVTRSADSSDVMFTPLLNDDTIVNAKFLAKLGNWGESKESGRKQKSKKSNKKGTVVISAPPEVSGKQGPSVRKRSVRP
ncbi:Putative Interleukin 2 receptor [Pristimantis euphronides]